MKNGVPHKRKGSNRSEDGKYQTNRSEQEEGKIYRGGLEKKKGISAYCPMKGFV